MLEEQEWGRKKSDPSDKNSNEHENLSLTTTQLVSLTSQPRHPTVRVLTVSTAGALTAWATGQLGAAPDMHCSLSGAPSGAALTLRELSAHCSAFAGVRWRGPLRWSRCSAGTPDSPVNYSGAASEKPEGEEFSLYGP
jgi:hypothetical protein